MADRDPMAVRRCSARARSTGEQCRQPAIRGGTVCRYHGGAAPQVRRSAKQRLAELAEPAVAALSVALESGDIHAVIKAAVAVLDRTGHHPRSSVHVELEEAPPRREPPAWMHWASCDELRQARAIAETAEARRAAGEPPLHPITNEDKNS